MWNRRLNCLLGVVLLLALAVCAGCFAPVSGGGAGRFFTKAPRADMEEQAPVQKNLALYAGLYEPIVRVSDKDQSDRMWHSMELDAFGRVSGGGNIWEPDSISYQPDGSIRLAISEDEFFTLYPAGLVPQLYASVLDSIAIKLEYTDYRDGVLQVLYYMRE